MPFHSGFVTLLGRPNAGKSTLLNALAGEKLAIVSPKPQTTRNRIQGILEVTRGDCQGQIILIDTPGVHKPDSALGRKMMVEVGEALAGSDLVLLIADAMEKSPSVDRFVLNLARRKRAPIFLLLNKIDRLEKRTLLPLIEEWRQVHEFQEIIPISALRRDGLNVLLERVLKALPQGPRYFPEDQLTDQPLRFMVGEIIREQILSATRQEIPYFTAVLVECFETEEKLTRIAAVIYCDRESQKRILVGQGGQMLKKIGTAARRQIEDLAGTRVYLQLFVKVEAGWRNSRQFVEELDWRRQLNNVRTAR
jgi:GTP-binding protein Era